MTPGTLAEGSALARRVLGSFGSIQSELFKILIDEYGYGVQAHNHSFLFQDMLASCGLSNNIHRYWHFYSTPTLLLRKYIHYTPKNTRLIHVLKIPFFMILRTW